MCLCFKPGVLFPTVDQDRVEPDDYAEWERLISSLVAHYRDRGAGIRYWEVANEPDIGESGGCPYRFKPESYVRYYRHTAAAILRADPEARVGGPALANVKSPILPALLDACDDGKTPLHFISWHIYSSDPARVRGTIAYAKDLLKQHPALKPETFLDEWNMDLQDPPLDPRFQPCYILETVWQMKDAGLDWSCYYQIKDHHVEYDHVRPVHVAGGRGVHDPVVEPDAPVRRALRFPGPRPAVVFRLQAPVAADGRAAQARVVGADRPRVRDPRREVPDRQPPALELLGRRRRSSS